jgi:MFS family permease
MGTVFGMIYLIAGSSGTLSAGWLIAQARENLLEATLKFIRLGFVLLLLPAIAAPIMPTFLGSMIAISVAIFLTSATVSVSSLFFQFSAPLPMRSQAIAVLTLLTALLGTGIGPLIIGVFSDAFTGHVQQPLAVALAVLPILILPFAILMIQIVLIQHRRLRLDLRQQSDKV